MPGNFRSRSSAPQTASPFVACIESVYHKLTELFTPNSNSKVYRRRLQQLGNNIIFADEELLEEVAGLLGSRPIPEQAYLQSQNIKLDMNADPEDRINDFVEQMTPKIVMAAKRSEELSGSDFILRFKEHLHIPSEEVFCATCLSWRVRKATLEKDIHKLSNSHPRRYF